MDRPPADAGRRTRHSGGRRAQADERRAHDGGTNAGADAPLPPTARRKQRGAKAGSGTGAQTPGRGPHHAKRAARPLPDATGYLAILALILLYAIAVVKWNTPLWPAAIYGVASVVTFIAYAVDKSAARDGRWRTPERSLLLLGVACGWPGAILAQQWLRHKSSKRSFRIAFWCGVAMNVALFSWLAMRMAHLA
ncbi:DUF1294 domain-containing protein [Oxalobacteraceae bacterium A2-2]